MSAVITQKVVPIFKKLTSGFIFLWSENINPKTSSALFHKFSPILEVLYEVVFFGLN